ncbi:MAG: MFS transporter [Prochloraceae cyanobacterium]
MDKSRSENAGSDFTLQVSLVFVGSYLTGGISGYIANAIGYRGVFAVACAISLIAAAIVAKVIDRETLLSRSHR